MLQMSSDGGRGRRREGPGEGTFVDWLGLLTLWGLDWTSVLPLVLCRVGVGVLRPVATLGFYPLFPVSLLTL